MSFVFFFKQKTAYEMRISDWSSDVCSSDLIVQASPLLTGEQARTTGRRALANYLASALLFPYAPFLAAAEDWRYDIERLAHHFGGSFEQTAHRLVTLRRPGAQGTPFAFLRSDRSEQRRDGKGTARKCISRESPHLL